MWFNKVIVYLLKSPLHGLMSNSIMLLTFTGRESGRVYTIPVNYVQGEDAILSISQNDRTWWQNLGDGEIVSLVVHGEKIKAASYVVDDAPAVQAALQAVIRQRPRFAHYYKIRQFSDGEYDQDDILRAAEKAILVKFKPL